ncbi:MAG: RES domain-containing protein, partial [Candidatus Eremiobacteraeota bacterium]|nr:RES domain-containing protein [Candidatus Eremiobacteraeota bacterium]
MPARKYLERHGTFLRLFEAGWDNCSDTSYSKRVGGRWNPPGEFGALYLNATTAVAAANARVLYAGSFYQPEDLTGAAELCLQEFSISKTAVLDCFTPNGVAKCGFPSSFPFESPHAPCQTIAREQYAA